MSSQRKSANFRPNPVRGIHVSGDIDQALLDRVTPSTLRIISESTDPVTLYIDSLGGFPYIAEAIQRLCKLPSQDLSDPHQVITVGLSMCASAACDLLIAGDYALAYPHTSLLCHGVRSSSDGIAVTRERAADMARNLAASNEQFAIQTASNAIGRFIFRYVMLRPTYPQIRENQGNENISDESCFLTALQEHLTSDNAKLVAAAAHSHFSTVMTQYDLAQRWDTEQPASIAAMESLLLKSIIEKQLADNKGNTDWSFSNEGFPELQARFDVLVQNFEPRHQAQIDRIISTWGGLLLSADQDVEAAAVAQEERAAWIKDTVQRSVRSLWFIFVSICRRLQQSENYLSAEEAYWLGLIDEVIGRPDLLSPRIFVEYAPAET